MSRLRAILPGERFGKLIAIEPAGKKHGSIFWKCRCDCGNEKNIANYSLISGNSKSCGCGCLNIKHGMSNTRINSIWFNMRQRCNNPHNNAYKYYGKRGISVCEEWLDFGNFYKWSMNNGYQENLTIDRKNNSLGYSPNNCRWTTLKVQANNTRKNVWIEYKGQNKTISQWSEITGLARCLISYRRTHGWSIEKILLTPARKSRIIIDLESFQEQLALGKTIRQTCKDYGITRATYDYNLKSKKEK
ncbi:MAG: hypothetical protein WCS30_14090 [Selenomonadaceae bacterium]